MRGLYVFLDLLFVGFHFSLIVFSLLGWIWRTTRRIHLIVLGLILASWFGLGLVYGIGYCPCTDWHWRVKRQLGEEALPNSTIKYYLDRLTATDWDSRLVDSSVLIAVLTVLSLSLLLNRQELRRGD